SDSEAEGVIVITQSNMKVSNCYWVSVIDSCQMIPSTIQTLANAPQEHKRWASGIPEDGLEVEETPQPSRYGLRSLYQKEGTIGT
ncbi:MAG: hypothetical protein R3335_05380, partial [Anaerolineales bacterium]|nr:hypothetical protein [Anaerolineales bacterium]